MALPDEESRAQMLARALPLLSQVLSNASFCEQIYDMDVWQQALRETNALYFDFGSILSDTVYAEFFAADGYARGEAGAFRQAVLFSTDSATVLLARGGNRLYRYSLLGVTGVRALASTLISSQNPLSASFYGQQGSYSGYLMGYRAALPVLTAGNGNWTNRDVFQALYYNAYNLRYYTDSDGTQVFVENNGSIRIAEGGRISFTAAQGSQGLPISKLLSGTSAKEESFGTQLAAANLLAQRLNESFGGQQTLRLTSVLSQEDTRAVTFSYTPAVEGIFIANASGIRITVRDAGISLVEASTVSYTNSDGKTAPLTDEAELKYLFLSSGLDQAEPTLQYMPDTATGLLYGYAVLEVWEEAVS